MLRTYAGPTHYDVTLQYLFHSPTKSTDGFGWGVAPGSAACNCLTLKSSRTQCGPSASAKRFRSASNPWQNLASGSRADQRH